jgi:hypothetical protein
MNVPPAGPPVPTRRREAAAGAAMAVVVALLIGVVGLTGGSGDGDRRPGAAAATSAPGSPAPTAVPDDDPAVPDAVAPGAPAPTGDASVLPAALPAVAFDQEASGEDGVRAQVVSLESTTGTAQGRGNIAGPALRATVRLVNGTSEPVDLGLVVVNLTHGAEGTPAPPLQDDSRVPFSGTLAPGQSAEGVYVFTVPEDVRDVVTLTVGYRAGAPFLVFSGSAD